MRISKEDGKGESASISTQRGILRRFAEENGIVIADEYADDGFSGTNFIRPDFLRLMDDIDKGTINTVIVKDFSRLGRNSARTSDLIDEFFPQKRVRFISVNDGYDSESLSGGAAVAAPLMMAVHEIYARDTSNKIRSAFKEKMKEGKYIGSFAPYGYKKSAEDKNILIVNKDVSHTVYRIFTLSQNLSPTCVAKILNEQKLSSPLQYRKTGEVYTEEPCWTASSVNKILRNPVYTGDMAQGKTSKISFKSKNVTENPREQWVIIPNTHEAIVGRELFDKVQKVRSRRRGVKT